MHTVIPFLIKILLLILTIQSNFFQFDCLGVFATENREQEEKKKRMTPLLVSVVKGKPAIVTKASGFRSSPIFTSLII